MYSFKFETSKQKQYNLKLLIIVKYLVSSIVKYLSQNIQIYINTQVVWEFKESQLCHSQCIMGVFGHCSFAIYVSMVTASSLIGGFSMRKMNVIFTVRRLEVLHLKSTELLSFSLYAKYNSKCFVFDFKVRLFFVIDIVSLKRRPQKWAEFGIMRRHRVRSFQDIKKVSR